MVPGRRVLHLMSDPLAGAGQRAQLPGARAVWQPGPLAALALLPLPGQEALSLFKRQSLLPAG
jgi:hypothetical protein